MRRDSSQVRRRALTLSILQQLRYAGRMEDSSQAMPGTSRLAFLDALRGLAALYVMLFHVSLLGPVAVPDLLAPIIGVGGSAVTLFFIISAFSLCCSSPRADQSWRDLARFWCKRLFRIAPLFFLVTAYMVVADARAGQPRGWLEIGANLTLIFGLIPPFWGSLVLGGWTIGVEMLFYLVFPVMLRWMRRPYGTLSLTFGAIALAYLAWACLQALPMNPSLRGDFYRASIFAKLQVFALGMAAYRIYRQWIAPRPMPATLGWVLMLAAALIFYAWIHNALPVLFFAPADDAPGYFNVKSAHGMLWQSSFYICLVLGLAIHSSPLVVNWLTLFCGRMSFSIYLLNPLVIIVLRPWLGAIAANHLPVSVTFILDLALVSGVLLPASWLTYTLIERPGMHLGNRIAARV